MLLRELFAEPADYRSFANLARLRAPVTEILRTAGIAPDVHAALDELAGGVRGPGGPSERAGLPGRTLPLFAAPHLAARLTPIEAMPPAVLPLSSIAEHTLIAVAAGGPVRVRRYALPRAAGGTARLAADALLQPADALAFDAACETFEVVEVVHDALMLTITGPAVADVLRDYDAESLLHRRTTSSSPRDSRVRFALLAMSALPAEPRAVAAASALTAHPVHHVRWNAVEALATLDPRRAREAVRGALDDPHPHVRDAARRTLERIDVVAAGL